MTYETFQSDLPHRLADQRAVSCWRKTVPGTNTSAGRQVHAGQTWHYNARHGEEKSTLSVLKVESLPKGIIIHIRVDGIRLRNCTGGPEPN